MTLAAWLVSLAGPIIIQALLAIGVGLLTVTGIDLSVNTALSWLTTAVGGISADMLNVMAMGGIFTGMSYIAGAVVARVAMAGASSITRFVVK